MGWLNGWSYRKKIVIKEQSGSTLTDYVVKIILNSSNFDGWDEISSDGGDIRFTDSDGSTVIPYWIEYWDSVNKKAVIWVKVPSIPASGTKIIYMYYGNPEATSDKGNPYDVFYFFDDFDAGLGKWNNVGAPTPKTFTNPEFHDGYGYSTEGDSWYASGSYSKETFDMSTSWRVIFRVKQLGGGTWDMFYVIGFGRETSYSESTLTHAYLGVRINGNNPDGHSENSNDIIFLVYNGDSLTLKGANDQQWHRYEFTYRASDRQVKFYIDDTLKHTATAGDPPHSALPLLISGRDYHNTNYLDYIGVSRYVDPEPTVTIESGVPIKYWDGSQWKDIKAIYYWDGNNWEKVKGIYYWDGNQWVRIL